MEDQKTIQSNPSTLSRGQQAQFETLWEQQRPRVWRLVVHLVGDRDIADDLTQEVGLRAFQGFGKFRGASQVSTWLYRIAVNVVLRYRERHREALPLDAPEVVALPSGGETDPAMVALRADVRPVVRAALDCLPEDLRTTLILQIYEGLKYREIADILHIPIGTVKSRLHSAMERLHEELKDYAL